MLVVTDVAGDGSSLAPLPEGSDGEQFEESFSSIRSIEHPIGNIPPTTLEAVEFDLYRAPSGRKIMFTSMQLSASDQARITWTARHKNDGSTVPEPDFEAVADLAASLCFDILAAAYLQTGDASFQADSVSYRTKGQEALALATKFRKRYFGHMGIAEGDGATNGGSTQGPAIAMGDVDVMMGWGGDRLTHGRKTR